MRINISCFIFTVLASHVFALRMGRGTISTSVETSNEPSWIRDVLIAVERSITGAYASAHDQRVYKSVYVDTKSGVELTRAERQYCFAFVFASMADSCLVTQGGKKVRCTVIYPDCAVAYSNQPVVLASLANP